MNESIKSYIDRMQSKRVPEKLNRVMQVSDLETLIAVYFETQLNKKFSNEGLPAALQALSRFDAGVCISGPKGVGKTALIKAFAHVRNMTTPINEQTRTINAKKFEAMYKLRKEELLFEFESGPLIIDDLGTENQIINNYGSKSDPISDLLTLRYDNSALTWATSNLPEAELAKRYGPRLADRFKEMWTYVEIHGNSKR